MSFNGRTPVSKTGNQGSNPCIYANGSISQWLDYLTLDQKILIQIQSTPPYILSVNGSTLVSKTKGLGSNPRGYAKF